MYNLYEILLGGYSIHVYFSDQLFKYILFHIVWYKTKQAINAILVHKLIEVQFKAVYLNLLFWKQIFARVYHINFCFKHFIFYSAINM